MEVVDVREPSNAFGRRDNSGSGDIRGARTSGSKDSLDSFDEEKTVPRDLVLTRFDVSESKGFALSKRCGHSLTCIREGVLFCYGGATEKDICDDGATFSIGSTTWQKETMVGLSPGALFGHSATMMDKGKLFVFGGLTPATSYSFDRDAPPPPSASSSADSGAAAPTVGTSRGVADLLSPGSGTSYTAPRNKLVRKNEESSNALHVLNTQTWEWTQPLIEGDPPSPRYMHSACAVGNLIIIFGGCVEPSYVKSLGDIHVFDTLKNMWIQPECKGAGPSARHGHTATHVGGGVMAVFGGANEDGVGGVQRFNTLYFLDTDTWTWTQPRTDGSIPIARSFHVAGVTSGSPTLLYICAGEAALGKADFCCLDVAKMRWSRPLYDSHFHLEMAAASMLSGKLAVFGGLSLVRKEGLRNELFLLNTVSINMHGGDNEYTFKIVLAGNSEVGKSCLMTRFVEDRFSDIHVSTIGVDFKTLTTMLFGKIVKLHIWDTAGQERFAAVTSHYYRGADGACLIYDITDADSFENLEYWKDSIEAANSSDRVPEMVLIGNKLDLHGSRAVSLDQAKAFAKKIKSPGAFETSALMSTNVDEAFMQLAKRLVEKRVKAAGNTMSPSGLLLGRGNGTAKSKKCCD